MTILFHTYTPYKKLFSAILISLIAIVSVHAFIGPGNIQYKLQKGAVIDTVRCKNDSTFNYALYLPSYYDSLKTWPVIFFFDPAARGSLPLKKYEQLAEEKGYIFAGSNNSRNGMLWDQAIDIADHMIKDVESKYTIHSTRRYASGFSGGSRAAAQITMSRNLNGVIGCGAGFPQLDKLPKDLPDFIYAGLVGSRDMNQQEMYDLEKALNGRGYSAVILTSDFGHSWPPCELYESAMEWVELQSMYAGNCERNEEYINTMLHKQLKHAEMLLIEDDFFESVRLYQYLIRDFNFHPEIPTIQLKIDSIIQTKQYIKALEEWRKLATVEREMQLLYTKELSKLEFTVEISDSIQLWWKNQIAMLRKMENNKHPKKSQFASRQLNFIGSMCYQKGENLNGSSQYTKLTFIYLLWTLSEPTNIYAHYLYARNCALNNEKRKAIESLETCVEMGFTHLERIYHDEAFQSLHESKQFEALFSRGQKDE